jgi:hypothetical protein
MCRQNLETIAWRIRGTVGALRDLKDGMTFERYADEAPDTTGPDGRAALYRVLLDALEREADAIYSEVEALLKTPKAVG